MARVDVSILKEIARIVQSRAKVPERIQVQKRIFLITYLDDHKQRIEEALRRHDPDRLNMLFGQLESKVKYQVIRRAPAAPRSKTSGSNRQARKSAATARKRSQASSSSKRVTKASRSTAAADSKQKKARKAAAKSPARKAALRAKSGRKRR